MIKKIEIKNYKCFKYLSRDINPFSVLIGPNASGKSTFIDIISLISDILNYDSIKEVIEKRTPDVYDLFFDKEKKSFEIAIESEIPVKYNYSKYDRIRYQIEIGLTHDASLGILSETVLFKSDDEKNRPIVKKTPSGNDKFYSEKGESTATEWSMTFKLGNDKSSLRFLPDDEEKFPIAIWFKSILKSDIKKIFLNSNLLQKPSPPSLRNLFSTDGSSLPWMISKLQKENEERYRLWLDHLQSVLPDLKEIKIIERPEDKHVYTLVEYTNNLKVPSWNLSDGTLRLLALTILAYIPSENRIYLIEEPENGIHPKALESVLQSLSSVYDAQVLLTTHSPIVLNILDPKDLLCFSRNDKDGSSILSGDEHPYLKNYNKEVSLAQLFAGGILG